MTKTTIQELGAFGQSVWLDNINRSMIETGKLKDMIVLGLRGMTSNPTIFDKAISQSNIYDRQIEELCRDGKSSFEIYDDLTIRDIEDAADIFKSVYEKTSGLDGYVSLEINPKLACNIQETIKEGKRLHKKVNRPNVMFKVPSTDEGFKAIEELTACGINVNVTLIFSVEQYMKAAEVYLKGIERFLKQNGNTTKVRSVASVFVSRIDTACDRQLDEMIAKEKDQSKVAGLNALKGKAAAANSKLIYKKYLDIFSSAEFKRLKEKGVNTQRVLWGSTSTKNPTYSDIKYVTELIGEDTVNTMPEATFEAFLDHGVVEEALTSDIYNAQQVLNSLTEFGIDIEVILKKLLEDGVIAFQKSFDSLLETLNKKTEGCKSRK